MDRSYQHLCGGHGIDILERFAESGFCGHDSLHSKAVRAVHGGGRFSGGGLRGRGRVYDLVSVKGNRGENQSAPLHFLFLYWIFLLRHHAFRDGRTADAAIL